MLDILVWCVVNPVHNNSPGSSVQSYVHRSGRTARGSLAGLSVVFVDPKNLLRFKKICSTLNRDQGSEIPLFPIDENIYDQVRFYWPLSRIRSYVCVDVIILVKSNHNISFVVL